MQQHDNTLPSLDPVRIAREAGSDALFTLLRERGQYVAQHRPLKALTKALRDEHALLLEGERGAGKTAMPEALAEACNLPHFFFACMDGVTVEEMLAAWDSTVQQQYVMQLIASGTPREQAQAEQWTLPFLNFGEIGAAFHYAVSSPVRAVLTIDEVDKLDNRRQDALLQALARGYFDVPRLRPDSRVGSVPRRDGSSRPFLPLVFLTSNKMRGGVSSPLRSRCYFTNIRYPHHLEQVAILRVRVPKAPPTVVVQVVKMMTYIRGMTAVVEKPALREMLDFTNSLVRDGVEWVTRDVIDDSLTVFAKLDTDEEAISERMSTIEDIIWTPEREIEAMVARVYDIAPETLTPPIHLRPRQTA